MVSTVGPTTFADIWRAQERSNFYDGFYHYVFYDNGTSAVYRYSADGVIWSGEQAIFTTSGVRDPTIWVYGNTVYCIGRRDTVWRIYFQRGTIGAPITWLGADVVAYIGSNFIRNLSICRQTDGELLIGFCEYVAVDISYHARVIRSLDDGATWGALEVDDTCNDGGFAYGCEVLPCATGKALVIYHFQRLPTTIRKRDYNGAIWSAIGNIQNSDSAYNNWDAVSNGDVVDLLYILNNRLYHVRSINGGVGFGGVNTVDANITCSHPSASYVGTTTYAFWRRDSTIYRDEFDGVAWAGFVAWVVGETNPVNITSAWTNYDGLLCAAWRAGNASPFDVRYQCFSVARFGGGLNILQMAEVILDL